MAPRKKATAPAEAETVAVEEVKEEKKLGKKKLYETPEALEAKIDEYFAECAGIGVPPDFAGMLLFLKMKKRTYYDYMQLPDYKDVFDDSMLRRESFFIRRMASEPKLAQGCMLALKQPINGGYIDKPEKDNDVKITIKLDGVGGEAAGK